MMTGSDMVDLAGRSSWWNDIARQVGERDIERQLLYNRVRKVSIGSYLARHVPGGIPALLPEFLKTLLGTLLAFLIITSLLSYFFHAQPVYTLAAFGLLYSLQATYYKYKLSVDPGYKIPHCKCAGAGKDSTEIVLRSRESAFLRIPNSAFGALLYAALVPLVYTDYVGAAILLAILALLASTYLAYVMVVRIGGLCSNCINVFTVNVLILWQLLR
jgi:uncharacterized membrane protein